MKHPRKGTVSPRLTGVARPLLDRALGPKTHSESRLSRHPRRDAFRIGSASKGVQLETRALPTDRIEQVARVDDGASPHRLRSGRTIDRPEDIVIDDEHERIGPFERRLERRCERPLEA